MPEINNGDGKFSALSKNDTFLAIIIKDSKRNQELMMRLSLLQEAWPEIGQAVMTTFAAQLVSHELAEIKGYVDKGMIQEKEAHHLLHNIEHFQKKLHFNPPLYQLRGKRRR